MREAFTPGNTGLIAAYAIASVSLASRVWPALAPYLAFVPAKCVPCAAVHSGRRRARDGAPPCSVYSAHHYLWTIVTYALCEPSLIVVRAGNLRDVPRLNAVARPGRPSCKAASSSG